MSPIASALAASLLIATLASAPTAAAPGFLTVKGGAFRDAEGRQVLLRGINVVNKEKAARYLGNETEADFARFREWGFNCVRLGVIWDGLEPEPGKYDEAYLKGLDERIRWAAKHGLYVFLDMHQDLYSVKYSDGAPAWATLDEGKPHRTGPVWSDAYMLSPAVQTAFDNFWANAPAQDGVGVQDHYARAWKRLAARYARNPAVIGYDLMNEPFIGSGMQEIPALMAAAISKFWTEKEGASAPSAQAVLLEWVTPEGRGRLMQTLDDIALFRSVMEVTESRYQAFEREKLQPMYQRVADAIRQADSRHILLLEPSVSANTGVRSVLEPVKGPDGRRDPLQALAPHGYDIVTDTDAVASASGKRIELIFTRLGDLGRRLEMPAIIGEWGAYYNSPASLSAARAVSAQMENLLCGDTYWSYRKDIDTFPFFQAVCRPYPLAVSGRLVSYASEPEAHAFTCSWEESPGLKAPSRIYLPAPYYKGKESIKLTPAGAGFRIERAGKDSGNVFLIVPPAGAGGVRKLEVE
ncbi:MAG: cellulase family glycosylhydrolase [Armatimonadetes bacterium]|nr:cellulase family glycosylhydrolase [Armatimonadota bacterium]